MTIRIFGILNLTPDSFSDGDAQASPEDFFWRARALIDDGADVLDIGAESTRPESQSISDDEEWERLRDFLILFRQNYPHFPLSLDTKKYSVAVKAMAYGVNYINDVSFLNDVRLLHLAKEADIKYILMHTRGNHHDMHKNTDYGLNFLSTLRSEIHEKLLQIRKEDFSFDHLILDPGFGFAKNKEQCVDMMSQLDFWREFNLNLMLGISRKRFLQHYIGETEPKQRDEISARLGADSLTFGFTNFRVHNVAMTKKFLTQASKKV